MTTPQIKLHAWTCDGIDLQASLNACASLWKACEPAPVALLYSVSQALLARCEVDVNRTVLHDHAGPIASIHAFFEARVFCTNGELRWCDIAGRTSAAYLSESNESPAGVWNADPVVYRSEIDNYYTLFGFGLESPPDGAPWPEGWSHLGNARIGAWWAPIPNIAKGKSVALQFREYLGLAPGSAGEKHGNVCVVEQRLLSLQAL